MNAIIYTRFSPRRKSGESESCETQEVLCRKHAKGKGWRVKSVHEDRAISGATSDRPGLTAAIADLRRGDVLLVYKRDRLAREVLIAELTKRQVKAAGATIAAVSGDVEGDDNDPTVIFIRQIMDAVGELERKMIAKRTSDAMRQHQKGGRKMGRFAPYGTEIDPADSKRLLDLPDEQKVIGLIKTMAAGGLGVADIHRWLVEYVPPRGNSWNYNTVKRIVFREEISIKGTDGAFHFVKM